MKKLAPTFIILIVSFILGEVSLRFISEKKKITILETLKYSNELRPKPTQEAPHPLHFKNKSKKIMGHPLRTNSLGLRGGEIDSSNTRRVLVLGSSSTLGWGVSEENSFVELVDKELPDTEVINAGVANITTEYQYNILKNLYPTIQPDSVVLQYFFYDSRVESQVASNWLLKNSFLATYFYSWYLGFKFSIGENENLFDYFQKRYAPDNPEWIDNQKSLQKISQFCKEKSLPLVVLLYPELHDVSENSPIQSAYKEIKRVLKGLDVEVLDSPSFQEYAGRERELWVSFQDAHGNKIVQQAMAKKFVEYYSSSSSYSSAK